MNDPFTPYPIAEFQPLIHGGTNLPVFFKNHKIKTTQKAKGHPYYCTFNDFSGRLLNKYPQRNIKPYKSDNPYSNTLLCFPINFFNPGSKNSPCLVGRYTTTTLIKLITEGKQHHKTIFERMDIRLPNGKYPHVTTHTARHYLTTIFLISSGGNYTEAQRWRGDNISSYGHHIHAYDHRDKAKENQAVMEKFILDYEQINSDFVVDENNEKPEKDTKTAKENPSNLELFNKNSKTLTTNRKIHYNQPKFISEMLAEAEISENPIQITEVGFCFHLWFDSPCDRNLACDTCPKHCWTKNLRNKKIIEANIAIMEKQKENCALAIAEGVSDESAAWHQMSERKLKNLKGVLEAMNAEEVPENSPIMLNNNTTPTKLEEAMRDKLGVDENVSIDRVTTDLIENESPKWLN